MQPQPRAPLPSPDRLTAPAEWPNSIALAALELEPKLDWAGGIRAMWRPDSLTGIDRLNSFIDKQLHDYSTERDRPAVEGTSRLSPYLHSGEISPHQVWHSVRSLAARDGRTDSRNAADAFLRQLGWREFAYNLIVHFPYTCDSPFQDQLEFFPWRKDVKALKAWQKGLTGYPLVDAGMRELWSTGWMHNRVRMIAGSFLVKDLLIEWREGAKWFWDTLVDADLANNSLGWQWVAGCGADAAPYFRIFNPVIQGKKFDPNGDYIRRWVPELSGLPAQFIHQPWEAPSSVLDAAGVKLGLNYPVRIVDHSEARRRALAALSIAIDAKKRNREPA